MNIQKAASMLVKMKQAQSVPVMADVIQNGMSPEQRTDFATRATGIFNKAKDIQAPAPFNNFLGHTAVKSQVRGLLGGIQENNPDVINSLADSNKQNKLQSVFDVNPAMYADVQKQFKNVVSPPLDAGLLNTTMSKGQDFSHAENLAKTASLVSSLSKGFKAINPFKHSSKPAPIPPFGGEPAKEVTAPKPAPQVQSPAPVQQPVQPVQPVEQPQQLSQLSRRRVMSGISYQPQPVITDNSFDAARAADVLTRNVPVVPNTPSNPNVIQTPLGNIDKHNMPDAISKLMPDEIGAQGAAWKLPDSNTTFNAEPMKSGIGASLAFNSKF